MTQHTSEYPTAFGQKKRKQMNTVYTLTTQRKALRNVMMPNEDKFPDKSNKKYTCYRCKTNLEASKFGMYANLYV